MNAIILVGGFGTRLRPLTLSEPKPLLPILNKPFISYQLDLLKKGGVKRVALAVGANARRWAPVIRRIAPKGLRLTVVEEKTPLGTGGAIRNAFDGAFAGASDGDLIVLNGDVFINLDAGRFVRFHRRKRSAASIALIRVADISRFGAVEYDGRSRVRRFTEKPPRPRPGAINAGAYVLTADFIRRIPRRLCSIERETFPRALREGVPVHAFPVAGYWNDIGTPETYLQAHLDLLHGTARGAPPARGRNPRVLKGPRCRIGKGTTFDGAVCLGAGVVVGRDVRLRDCVVLDGARIEEAAELTGALIGRRAVVGSNARIGTGTVLGEGTRVTPYSRC